MGMLGIKLGAVGFLCLGCFISYQCVRIQNSGMPSAIILSSLDSSEGKYLKNKYRYFVDADDDKNKKWWKGSFNYRWFDDRWHQRTSSSPFQLLTGIKGLREACKKMYGKSTAEVDEMEKRDMFRYCSPLGQMPQMVDSNSFAYDSNSWALKKASELVSTHNESNKQFWYLQNTLFFDHLGNYDSNTKNEESKKTPFDKFYDTKGRRTIQTLREVCNSVYSSPSTEKGDGKVTEADLVKYCGYADIPPANNG